MGWGGGGCYAKCTFILCYDMACNFPAQECVVLEAYSGSQKVET